MVEHSHTISTAAAEIVALINSRSHSPWPHEIEAIIAKAIAPQPMASPRMASASVPKLASDIRAKIAELGVAYDALGRAAPWTGVRMLAEADGRAAEGRPAPPGDCRSPSRPQSVRRHRDARQRWRCYWAARRMATSRSCATTADLIRHTLADLIEAVLQFAGRDFAKAVAPTVPPSPALLPPLSPDHLRYREALAEIAKLDDSRLSRQK